VQYTKPEHMLRAMGVDPAKTERALEELRRKGLD
jgi:hypothetical protein